MPREAYAGRVGGLAVALGVAAAMVTGWSSGIAQADESGDSAGSTASSTASSTEPGTAKPGATGVESESPGAAQGSANSSDTGATSATNTDSVTDRSTAKEDEGRSAPPEVVAGTADVTEEDSTPASNTAESGSAAPQETGTDDDPTIEPAASKGSDRRTANPAEPKTPAPVSSVADAKNDADPSADATTDDAIDPTGRSPAAPPQIASTQSAAVAVPDSEPTSRSTPPEASQPDVIGVVSRVVSGVVSAILSPFAASNTPGTPVGVPSIWSLLAFARREFETAFNPPALTGAPVDAQTTSETLDGVELEQRTLVLTAFPAEADAILARTTLDENPTVVVDGRHFYLGSVGGKKVIVAMTGIGMVNATNTTEAALSHFTPESGISIGAMVFAGVAGGSGRTEIGSVAVPARWTSDDGATWRVVDAGMLAVANELTVDLKSTAALGDPLCLCSPLARFPLVDLKREPQLFVGGDGSSDDNNNGTAFPAIPFGGDIFGPQPCAAPNRSLLFTGNFFQEVGPFLASGLLSNLSGLLAADYPSVDAVDMETAAAQQVADAHGVPFLGIRGMSDGPGDPLNLPGYPFTFFVYKQVAADNAAIVTEAFLQNWDGD